MTWRETPQAQIALMCLRGLNLRDARWMYVALASCAAIVLVGGGISMQWGISALVKTVLGAIVFSLQIAWIGVSTVLLRLNQPGASRLVPGYVTALRRTTVGIWLGICTVSGAIGLLNGGTLGWMVFGAFASGAVMLFISAPLRWPVRWFLSLFVLSWLGRHVDVIIAWGPTEAMLKSSWGLSALAVAILAGMAWIVGRMISDRGNAYASLFSRFMAMQEGWRVADKPTATDLENFGPWVHAYACIALAATLPWRRYAGRLLVNPQPGPHNALARAELGLGPVVHWVSQLSACAVLAFALWGVVLMYPQWLMGDDQTMSSIAVFYVALLSGMCAATSVLYLPDTFLRTEGEQKLMLLLPGMPCDGNLNRLLATRHLTQTIAAWLMATLWALVLPYPESISQYVAAYCWGTLPLVPWVLQDWSALRTPKVSRGLVELGVALLVPVSAWAALKWLHLPAEVLAGLSVTAFLLVLRVRWASVAHCPQAFPAGRLAQNQAAAM